MLPKQEKRRVSRQRSLGHALVTRGSRAKRASRLHTAPQNEKFPVYNSPLVSTILVFAFQGGSLSSFIAYPHIAVLLHHLRLLFTRQTDEAAFNVSFPPARPLLISVAHQSGPRFQQALAVSCALVFSSALSS
jgi:hypothetical protein